MAHIVNDTLNSAISDAALRDQTTGDLLSRLIDRLNAMAAECESEDFALAIEDAISALNDFECAMPNGDWIIC